MGLALRVSGLCVGLAVSRALVSRVQRSPVVRGLRGLAIRVEGKGSPKGGAVIATEYR